MLHTIQADGPYGAKLTTDAPFAEGDLILRIEGHRVTRVPSYQTIQISRHEHIEELGRCRDTRRQARRSSAGAEHRVSLAVERHLPEARRSTAYV